MPTLHRLLIAALAVVCTTSGLAVDLRFQRVADGVYAHVGDTGGQDHRWLGNGWFVSQGAEIVAHANGKADMLNRGNDHLQGLKGTLGAKVDGTVPTLPAHWLAGNDERLLNSTELMPGNASRTYLEIERE